MAQVKAGCVHLCRVGGKKVTLYDCEMHFYEQLYSTHNFTFTFFTSEHSPPNTGTQIYESQKDGRLS